MVIRRATDRRVDDPHVLVVGGGPTGLTAANLLGALGISVLLVERNPGTSDDAKAISLDDESLRAMQLADLDRAVAPIVVPGTGTKYYGARGQELVHARGVGSHPFGHPFKNPFAQPEFERVLREGLDRFPHVQQRFGTALVGLDPSSDGVGVTLQSDAEGTSRDQVHAEYVLACDGGRSTVRELLGITMTGESFDEVWLVADTLDDPHDQRYGMHHGDPERPHVIVPGRDGRCRYEFLLKPGEGDPGRPPAFPFIRQLLAPFRTVTREQIERAVTYRFHALLADRLRADRCFLLGDAAHMMPPFAGQGLNSGIRDAANLAWKIAEVLEGRATDALLDTYEAERRPHARAVIDLSVRLGRIVMTTDHRRAHRRDVLVALATRTRPGRRYLTEMRYRPTTRFAAGAVAPLGRTPDQSIVGTPLPQPRVLRGPAHIVVRLDDVLGTGWSLLGVDVRDEDWATVALAAVPTATCVAVVLDDRAARKQAGRVTVADADGGLDAVLARVRGRFVLVRPDRVVAAVFGADRATEVATLLGRAGLRAPGDGAATPGNRPATTALLPEDDTTEGDHARTTAPPLPTPATPGGTR